MVIKLQVSALSTDIDKSGQPLAVAMGMLVRAYQYARDTNLDRWEFAIPISEFRFAGVTINELRWLLFSGLAIHARQTVHSSGQYRKYIRLDIRSFPPEACFILSDQGVKTLEATRQSPPGLNPMPSSGPAAAIAQRTSNLRATAIVSCTPHWDPSRRELTFRGEVVKSFRSTAPNQERILTAFQEEKWARRIDDPLPPESEHDSRERLRSAIKQLNRNQDNSLVRFCGDGSGKGIRWQGLV